MQVEGPDTVLNGKSCCQIMRIKGLVNVARLTMLRIDAELTQRLQLGDWHSWACVGMAGLPLKPYFLGWFFNLGER